MSWSIGDIDVDFVADSSPQTITRGDEITLPVLFADSVVVTSEAGGASQYSTGYNFEYESLSEDPSDSLSAYRQLREYLTYAGDATVRRGTTDRGVPWYRERLPDDSPVDSLVVDVVAPDSHPEPRDFWGIIVGGEDISTTTANYRQLELTVFVLADRSAFNDREAVEAEFGDEIQL